jgi:hypothetical protein
MTQKTMMDIFTVMRTSTLKTLIDGFSYTLSYSLSGCSVGLLVIDLEAQNNTGLRKYVMLMYLVKIYTSTVILLLYEDITHENVKVV